jgi:hypothetical protein
MIQRLDSASNVQLKISYQKSGMLEVGVYFSRVMSGLESELLNEPNKLFIAEGKESCVLQNMSMIQDEDSATANYLFSCGEENKLNNMQVQLLDNFDNVEEVEVFIETPAAKKHFAISRGCKKPIFGIDR